MKKNYRLNTLMAIFVLAMFFCKGCMEKEEEEEKEDVTLAPIVQSMGFVQRYINPRFDGIYDYMYRPQLKVLEDTLYVCTNNGIYRKNLETNSEWELYAFENTPIIEFVKNGNKLLAISTGTEERTDSLLLLSNNNGQTFINYTSSHFLEYGGNVLNRLVQNPENKNVVFVLYTLYGVSKSDDFGLHWRRLTENNFGAQNWHLSIHPLDTNTIFCSGENMVFQGTCLKSSDGGETWSAYTHPDGDNCIHSIAYHPTNPDILVYGGEGTMGKSTDKGETWHVTDLHTSGIYFFKVLFDEQNPSILYATGYNDHYGLDAQNAIWVYRSADMGNSWELAYNESINENCGGVFDMVKYKNTLIFYTRESGLFQLSL